MLLDKPHTLVQATPVSERNSPVKIVIVTDNTYPPFMYESKGKVVGINIELVEAVDLVLEEYDIDIETMKWPTALSKIRNGEAIAILGPYFHAYSLSKMYPYSYPLVKETVVTVCHSNLAFKNDDPNWPNDYSGTKMGTVAGFAGWSPKGLNVRNIDTMNFFEFPNTKLALNGVVNGVVDCSIFEKNVFTFYQRQAQKNNNYAFDNLRIVNVLNEQTTHLGYSQAYLRNNPASVIQEFSKQFDAAFIQLKREGKLGKIYNKYGISDY